MADTELHELHLPHPPGPHHGAPHAHHGVPPAGWVPGPGAPPPANTLDWNQLGQSLVQTGGILRLFGLAVGASVAAGLLIDGWKWLRRPPAR